MYAKVAELINYYIMRRREYIILDPNSQQTFAGKDGICEQFWWHLCWSEHGTSAAVLFFTRKLSCLQARIAIFAILTTTTIAIKTFTIVIPPSEHSLIIITVNIMV